MRRVSDLLKKSDAAAWGVVYRARDLELDREVAVKILQPRYEIGSPTALRFVEEARITAQLQHPGIPAVYRVATLAGGRPFLAMKLVKGETLDVLRKAGAVNYLSILEGVAQALGYAYSRKVIHRDLKPSNVMVGAFGEVQIMDWGLAKVLVESPDERAVSAATDETTAPTVVKSLRESDGSVTQAGSVLGTPSYMSPEQAAGELEKVDERADVFGLGAVLCNLLTGQPPFEGKDAESVRLNAVRGNTEKAFARLDSCDAEPDVVALCKRCLAFEPADRPRDANEVHAIVTGIRREAEERARQAEFDAAKAEIAAAEQSKRRRMTIRWSVVVVGVLMLGIAGTSLGLFRADGLRRFAETQTDKANGALAEAKRQSELATAVKDFLQNDMLKLADPEWKSPDEDAVEVAADVRLRDVALRAAKGVEGKFLEQPLVEEEIRLTLGQTLRGLGEYELALSHWRRLHELCQKAYDRSDQRVLAAMKSLGNCLWLCGQTAYSRRGSSPANTATTTGSRAASTA
jgi:hypothetical protein